MRSARAPSTPSGAPKPEDHRWIAKKRIEPVHRPEPPGLSGQQKPRKPPGPTKSRNRLDALKDANDSRSPLWQIAEPAKTRSLVARNQPAGQSPAETPDFAKRYMHQTSEITSKSAKMPGAEIDKSESMVYHAPAKVGSDGRLWVLAAANKADFRLNEVYKALSPFPAFIPLCHPQRPDMPEADIFLPPERSVMDFRRFRCS